MTNEATTDDGRIKGTPFKLDSGDWGAKVRLGLAKGLVTKIVVVTRSGKSWSTLGKVIWSDGETSIMTTGIQDRKLTRKERSKVDFEGYADLHAPLPKNPNYHGGHVKTVK